MEVYSGIEPFGYHRNTWERRYYYEDSAIPWRDKLNERLEVLLKNTFSESSLTDEILKYQYHEDFAVNASTIENSLLFLQNYLGFVFQNPDEVIEYILQYRSIYDVVLYACILTEEAFGQSAQISLELYHDPEIKDEYLTIYVRQTDYEIETLHKIDAICKEFQEALEGVAGWLLVTTDFRPPMV